MIDWLLNGTLWIKSNEAADQAAKEGLNLCRTDMSIQYSDLKRSINIMLKPKWQSIWDEADQNKLHQIQPVLGKWKQACRLVNHELYILTNLITNLWTMWKISCKLNMYIQWSLLLLYYYEESVLTHIRMSYGMIHDIALLYDIFLRLLCCDTK